LGQAAQRITAALKDAQKQLERLQARGVAESADELAKAAENIAGVNLVTRSLPNADVNALSSLADGIADKLKSVVVILAGVGDGRVTFVGKVTPDLVAKGLHAGNILREVAKATGGGGGGKPEFAQAGGKDPSKVESALALVADLVRVAVKT
jgi:alanyl-tRNA synthetase